MYTCVHHSVHTCTWVYMHWNTDTKTYLDRTFSWNLKKSLEINKKKKLKELYTLQIFLLDLKPSLKRLEMFTFGLTNSVKNLKSF